ncbi:unnamed protein product [Cuscuta europaea]|nr:unnamed protein product [Cuscuta europaea]
MKYVDGDDHTIYRFDPDFLCFHDIQRTCKEELGFITLKNIYVLVPGKDLDNGLFLVEDDDTIRKVLNQIRNFSWIDDIELYVDHQLDEPLLIPQIEWSSVQNNQSENVSNQSPETDNGGGTSPRN